MKPVLSWYGGKQKMLKHILPLIPPHEIYVEPFAGGAAVFFAKRPAKVEVLNDTNDNLITFYRVMKSDFEALNVLIQGTLHSESDYRKAANIYRNPGGFSDVERAWAVWVQCALSFGGQPMNGFGTGKYYPESSSPVISERTMRYKENIPKMDGVLKRAMLFSRPALDLPEIYNTPESFWYLDPPYFNSDMGHYKGYTVKDFCKLLVFAGTKLKGKFMLSMYPSPQLDRAVKMFGWNYREFRKTLAVDGRRTVKKTKIEVIVTNYPDPVEQRSLFDQM